MDGLMGQHVQLKTWLIAQSLGQTESIHTHVVRGAFGPGATSLKPVNNNTKLLKPVDQTVRLS